ncbi:unnamed protein product, partial [Staurois parvus]
MTAGQHLGHMTDPRSRRTNHKAQVLLAHAHWAPGCHAERHYRSREDSARLDRGTGKIGYLSNSGTRSPPPQRSAVICTVRSLWSSLCCPQSLVIPVLSAV